MTDKTENGKRYVFFGPGRVRLDQMLVALAFMTRLPVPYRDPPIADAAWAFPLAGAVVGLFSGAVLWAALELALPPYAAALLTLLASAMLTGALHEDGLADCADGFWGGHSPQRRLEIMRDSRSGAYGVLALILATGLKAVLIGEMAGYWGAQPVWMMLVASHALARAGLPLAMALIPAAGKTGLAAMAGRPDRLTAGIALLLGTAIAGLALSVTPDWMALALLATVGAVTLGLGVMARAKLGGLNGDCLGAMEQVSEIACLMMLAIILGT